MLALPCIRPDCIYRRNNGVPRRHGYCCNACRRGEEMHTRHCTGYRFFPPGEAAQVAELMPPRLHLVPPVETPAPRDCLFHFPAGLTRTSTGLGAVAWVQWYLERFQLQWHPDTQLVWQRAALLVERVANPERQPLVIHVRKLGDVPSPRPPRCIDVHEHFHVDARPRNDEYQLSDVSGFDFRLQANLVLQCATAEALVEAIYLLELDERAENVTFLCLGATHRSLGCACLLAMWAYPNATLQLNTLRTIADARSLLVEYSPR